MRAYALTPGAAGAAAKRAAAGFAPVPKAPRVSARWSTILAVLVVVVLAAGAYAWRAGYAPRLLGASVAEDKLATAPRLSIVVLPFENLSGDKEQDYFADGITDDLTTDLSHLPDSFVIARGTAFTYKGKPVDAKDIGRELGVRYLLEGSVRRVGETVTINAQLISTDSGAHVWADRFDGDRINLGELQVGVVSRLANSLGVELVRAEALRAMRERPRNPDAVDLAMQGWASLNSGFNKSNYDAAIDYFERALQLDPELTRAQVGLAWGLVDRVFQFRGGDQLVDLPRSESLLSKVLAAEPNSALAHYVKADFLTYEKKQFNDALSELDVAIDNDRNFARAYSLRAGDLIFSGEAKAAAPQVETALQLSPRDPLRNQWEFRLCHAHAHLAEWEQAAEWCQRSIATNAGYWLPYIDLAAASGWLGREGDAKAAIAEQSCCRISPYRTGRASSGQTTRSFSASTRAS